MRSATLGRLGQVSRLTLGGGGIGQIWGETDKDEAIATLHAALDAGIDVLDTAPMYGACEAFVGEAFGGRPPPGLRITSKCYLGTAPAGESYQRLSAALTETLKTMRLETVDLYFLHSNIHADDLAYTHGNDRRDLIGTRWTRYVEDVVPAFERLKAEGRIGAWGITGIGVPSDVIRALGHEVKPTAVQCIANLMDSAGALRRYAEPARPRDVIAAARANGVGVMGIRAVQAGALTAAVDRPLSANSPDNADYDRAAPFRALCRSWGEDPAYIAHRYAAFIDGVDTLVLGVKNRVELAQCVKAEADGPLEPERLVAIEALGLRPDAG